MIVLVNLKEGVSPADYETWVLDSYAPAARSLPSISDWRNHRVDGMPGSGETPPYRYVVTLEVDDMEELGRDAENEETQRLLRELHGLAEVTQLVAEWFA